MDTEEIECWNLYENMANTEQHCSFITCFWRWHLL